jgi:integrase
LKLYRPQQARRLGCHYIFWTGLDDRDGHIKTVVRTLKSVFEKSGVAGSAHRFRHTLATEVFVNGGSIEDAANILGDSADIIRKHYAKWSVAYQRRTVDLFRRIHGMLWILARYLRTRKTRL